MKKIDAQEQFVQESEALLGKINENIADLAQYERVEMDQPSVSIIEKLNRLKYRRKQLQNTLERLGHGSSEAWMAGQTHATEIFRKAQAEWLEISKARSDS